MLISSIRPYAPASISQPIKTKAPSVRNFEPSSPKFAARRWNIDWSKILPFGKKADPTPVSTPPAATPAPEVKPAEAVSPIPQVNEPFEGAMAFLVRYGIKPERLPNKGSNSWEKVYKLSPTDFHKIRELKKQMAALQIGMSHRDFLTTVKLNDQRYTLSRQAQSENKGLQDIHDYTETINIKSPSSNAMEYTTNYEQLLVVEGKEYPYLVQNYSAETLKLATANEQNEILGNPYKETHKHFFLQVPKKLSTQGDPELYHNLMKAVLGEKFDKASKGESVTLADEYQTYQNNPTAENAYWLLASHPNLLKNAIEALAQTQGKTEAQVLNDLQAKQ